MSIESNPRLGHLSDQEMRMVRDFVARLHARFDGELVSAILFGSRARGDAAPDSDMDVMVILANAPRDIRRDVRDLATEVWLEHGIFLSTRVSSEAHWQELEKMQTGFYCNVCRDGIQLTS
jgi:predicted nucleotidyltransferase